MWDLSCPDWETRIKEKRSLVPDLDLNETEAAMGLALYDELPLPDGLDEMTLGEASGQWFRDMVRAVFGSWDPETRIRSIRDFFLMAPKGSSKTTYSAGLMLTAMLMNRRRNIDALFIGPTQSISDRAYEQAAAMVRKSAALSRRFKCIDHKKTIKDLDMNCELKVKTFALDVLTGEIVFFVLLDELHVLGTNPNTTKVLRQIRGGLDKTQEGALLITTTQSDEIPAGAFSDELVLARKIRNGVYRGKSIRSMLPVLYEFPQDIAKDQDKWSDPDNWPMVMPNLGRSVHLRDLIPDWNSEREKGDKPTRIWASQHLNVEMGVGMGVNGWAGAQYWTQGEDSTLTVDELIERCEVVIVGLDGGGLDDLYGVNLLGRERNTRDWLSWSHAWCHEIVLTRRKSIATRLKHFEAAGDLTIYETAGEDVVAIVDLIRLVKDRGLLGAVAVDPAGLGEMVEALADPEVDVTVDNKLLVGAPQGFGMMNAIKTAERKLQNGTLRHAKSALMDWCVGNVKIEPMATAIRATKQNAGDAKIDPWAALMNGVWMMARNPEAQGVSVFDLMGDESAEEAQSADETVDSLADEAAILRDHRHPRWQEMRERYEARLAASDLDDVYA